ncbi:uncharacterized protein LOC126788427 [Argentina anserina]|uniref:uncharacterized protein LOC126788427 n=1 Tax=Argentina anserina TaxID=57926 RepID=UPI0021767230|nr:uncharacterized protein LOC126788427 [Potentilla anserina]
MELLYLLCSIISTFLTSLTLSLLLPLRILLRRLSPSSSSAVSLYQGTVFHERRRPVHHSFRYSVRYALIDLDDSPHALPNHLSSDEARRISGTSGRALLLTIPESVGYEENPLSLYYCYDDQTLKNCIAEVTNTPWGERVLFVFDPNSDLVAKPLHVSPFMDMIGNWNIRTNAPDDTLFVSISVQHPDLGNYFTATLKAKRVPSSLVSDHALFFWLMPHKVAVWIYWHAFKLWWKNVAFIQHPRYTSPGYREEALVRNQKLQCCPAIRLDKEKHLQFEGSSQGCRVNNENESRYIKWRDAKWPWS